MFLLVAVPCVVMMSLAGSVGRRVKRRPGAEPPTDVLDTSAPIGQPGAMRRVLFLAVAIASGCGNAQNVSRVTSAVDATTMVAAAPTPLDLHVDPSGRFDAATIDLVTSVIERQAEVRHALGPDFVVLLVEPIGRPGSVTGASVLVRTHAPVLLPIGSPTFAGTETEAVEIVTTEPIGPLSNWWVQLGLDSSVRAFLAVPDEIAAHYG